jgi:hypothetical protein
MHTRALLPRQQGSTAKEATTARQTPRRFFDGSDIRCQGPVLGGSTRTAGSGSAAAPSLSSQASARQQREREPKARKAPAGLSTLPGCLPNRDSSLSSLPIWQNHGLCAKEAPVSGLVAGLTQGRTFPSTATNAPSRHFVKEMFWGRWNRLPSPARALCWGRDFRPVPALVVRSPVSRGGQGAFADSPLRRRRWRQHQLPGPGRWQRGRHLHAVGDARLPFSSCQAGEFSKNIGEAGLMRVGGAFTL